MVHQLKRFHSEAMTLEKCTLLVRHLPTNLTTEDVEEMLKTFGAVNVYQVTKNPKMKDMAFAAFANPTAAQSALQNLHQLEIFGRRLIVEYALDSKFPNAAKAKLSERSESNESKTTNEQKEKHEVPAPTSTHDESVNIGLIADMIGLTYPFSPKLVYRYPAPTPSIVSNIAKALIDVPKFYWQVLHLMNKMNLPAPFGPCSQPALFGNVDEDYHAQFQESEEESELESETEMAEPTPGVPISMERLKRSKTSKRISKKAKIQSMLGHSNTPADAMNIVPETINPAEVFELPNPQASKKIEFKLVPGATEVKLPESEASEQSSFGTFSATATTLEDYSDLPVEATVEEEKKDDFITDKELRENRMQGEGLKLLPAFKKYEAGKPSDRLYLKNLAKQVEEKDLNYIYGRYVDQASEEKSRFSIRLMKEGRMKGQAFVTMPDVTKARAALADTLGYMLHGKPIVVQFAHSAKAQVTT